MSIDTLLGYVAIGLCAALAAMMWPFRRGPVGVLLEVAAGIGGAVGLAALSYAIFPPSSTMHLAFAAAGAIVTLLLVHGVWLWVAARARRDPNIAGPGPAHR